MTKPVAEATRLIQQATSQRKRGDAYRKIDREASAISAFKTGLGFLDQAIAMLNNTDGEDAASELAEAHGARGGLLRRSGGTHLEDALQAYSDGARLEIESNLPSTYNRLNAIKLRLLLGNKKLVELEDELKTLADSISNSIRSDPEMRRSGWAYADLGDCLALLGDLDDARDAYATFISKGETKSPETTLQVLKELTEKLVELNDPDAARVTDAFNLLKSRL